jgi:hypothetical protein
MRKAIIMLALWLGLSPASLLAYNYVTPGQFISNKTLVTFWSSDCSACSRQVPILISLARFNPDIHIAIVQLPGSGPETIPTGLPSNMRVFGVDDGATSLRAFGATQSMLPFSAIIRPDGSVCTSHAGVQAGTTFEDWAKKC